MPQRIKRKRSQGSSDKSPGEKKNLPMKPMKHGLTEKDLCLPGEDPEKLITLRRRIDSFYQAEGIIEQLLAEQIEIEFWRLGRIYRLETSILQVERLEATREPSEEFDDKGLEASIARIAKKYDGNPFKIKIVRGPKLGRAFSDGISMADAIEKVSRHKTGIERSLFAKIRELERMQSERRAREEEEEQEQETEEVQE